MPSYKVIGIDSTNKHAELLITTPDPLTGSVGVGLSIAVDTVVTTSYKSIKYDFVLWTTSKVETFTMLLNNSSGTVSDVIFSRVGDRIIKNLDSQIVLTDTKVFLENNEAEVINYSITKTKFI